MTAPRVGHNITHSTRNCLRVEVILLFTTLKTTPALLWNFASKVPFLTSIWKCPLHSAYCAETAHGSFGVCARACEYHIDWSIFFAGLIRLYSSCLVTFQSQFIHCFLLFLFFFLRTKANYFVCLFVFVSFLFFFFFFFLFVLFCFVFLFFVLYELG